MAQREREGLRRGAKVAGYYRISKERDGMTAPEIYEDEIKQYCKAHGLQLVKTYSDIGVSGRASARHKRKGLDALLKDRAEYEAVVMPMLNRFGRSVKDLATLFETFDNDGISLVFIQENIDTSTLTGRFMRTMFAGLAEMDSDRISESWIATREHTISTGRIPAAAQTPVGYMYDGALKNIVPDKELAPVVQEIFHRYNHGEAPTKIAYDLNERGIPCRRRIRRRQEDGSYEVAFFDVHTAKNKDGAKWYDNSIKRMLDQPVYTQRLAIDGPKIGVWEALISDATFKATQKRRKALAGTGPANGGLVTGKRSYLLSGLIEDTHGHRLHHIPARIKKNGKVNRPAMYACQQGKAQDKEHCTFGGIAEHRAEKFVVGEFLALATPARVANMLQELEAKKAPKAKGVSIEDRQSKLRDTMQRLTLQLASAGPLQQEAVQEAIANTEAEYATLEAKRTQPEEETDNARKALTDIQGFVTKLDRYSPNFNPATDADELEQWYALDRAERRYLLAQAIKRVVVLPGTPKQVEIHWQDWIATT